MARAHLEDGSKLGFKKRSEDRGRMNLHVEDPLALVLTPACHAWALLCPVLGGLSGVLERGRLGTNGDGTIGVPYTGPG
jgi:hypothetical protein